MDKIQIGLLGGIMFLSSCSTVKNVTEISEIDGEWNIVKVNGTSLSAKSDTELPFIGFDTESGRIYGNSGCNRIMAPLDIHARPGSIEFKQAASTMMACPAMDLEKQVLGALSEIKSYQKTGKKKLTLRDSSDRPVVVLEKRFSPMAFAELQGGWHVLSVFSQPLSKRKSSFIIFDTEEKTIMADTGCKRITGALKKSADGKISLSLSKDLSGKPSCPDSLFEDNLLTAISSARTYGKLDKNKIAFYTSGGTQVLVLQKMEK